MASDTLGSEDPLASKSSPSPISSDNFADQIAVIRSEENVLQGEVCVRVINNCSICGTELICCLYNKLCSTTPLRCSLINFMNHEWGYTEIGAFFR